VYVKPEAAITVF